MDQAEQQLYQYRLDTTNTATPEQLTLMLYEAALGSVESCIQSLAQDPQSGWSTSELARDILAALADDVNVNHPHGQTMKDLYGYCWRTLMQAATSKDGSQLVAVKDVLKNLIMGLEEYRQPRRVATTPESGGKYHSLNFAG